MEITNHFLKYIKSKHNDNIGVAAIKNNCILRTSTLQHNVADDLRSINCDVTSFSGMTKSCFYNLVDTLD